MQLPLDEKLDIAHLEMLFDNMAESYKLFWFHAIVNKVKSGQTRLSYDELINNMIADAWFLVTECHLNLCSTLS